MAFAEAAGLTGVVITKLDGTARGGVALAVSSEAGLPIRFIGAGEGIRDLRPFNSTHAQCGLIEYFTKGPDTPFNIVQRQATVTVISSLGHQLQCRSGI